MAINRDDSYSEPITVDWETTPAKWHPDCLFCRELDFDPVTQELDFDPVTQEITITDIPKIEPSKNQNDIDKGNKITEDVFWGNPYAQLADMVKAQIITLALLVPVLGKETVKMAYADLLATVQKVSESRVSQGLEPYDLSFLD